MIRRRKISYLRFLITRLTRKIKKKQLQFRKNKLNLKTNSRTVKTNNKIQAIGNVKFDIVYSLKYLTCTDQNNQLFRQLAKLIPLKLIDCPMPTYKYPNKVKVVISKPDKSKKSTQIFIPYEDGQHSNTLYEQIPLQQYLEYQGELQLSIAQMGLQKNLVHLPDFVTRYFTQTTRGITKETIKAINLWHYKGNRISSWHYDGHDNFLFIIEGKKIIYLMQPNKITGKTNITSPQYHTSKGVFDLNHNHSKIDDFASFIDQKNCSRCQINKGECLYIPRGWWHYVQSYGQPNIAINVWGNSIKNLLQKNDEEMVLKHLIFEVSDRISKRQQNLQSKEDCSKSGEQNRKQSFSRYFNKIME